MTETTQSTKADLTHSEPQQAVIPAVDVFEDSSGITLVADIPGVPKEQLDLKVEGDALLIEGGVQQPTPDGLEAVYAEVRIPRYRRRFTLSRELDTAHRRQPQGWRADIAHSQAGPCAAAPDRRDVGLMPV